jgi:hemerythrin
MFYYTKVSKELTMAIEWTSSLSVQVKLMDDQHKTLLNLINELNEAMRKGQGKDLVGKTINNLLSYTETHFAAEEKLFDQHSYPAASGQKLMHKKFVDKIIEFKKQHESGKMTLSFDVIDFLSDWLKKHIQIEDKKYGSFFNEKGVK